MDEARRTRKNLWMFPLGTVGRDMIYTLFTNFILTYILFTRSLTAAQLSAITAIMVAARVFDALNDPIMGNIIERTRSRYGKFKPWLLAGILLTSAVVYAAFNTRLEGWSFVAFFGFIYLMYSIAYTMHDISYWGMVAALGSDEDTRNRFTSRATLLAGVGATLASVVIPMFTTGEMALGGNAETAYGRVALIVCLLAPLFLCFTIFGVRENRDEMKEKAPPVSFRKIWNTITGNDQLLWIALIFLVQQVGNNLVAGGIGSTYIYLAFGYRGGLYSLFTIVGVAATAFLMVFYPTISRHITRKRLMSIMMAVSTVGYALTLGLRPAAFQRHAPVLAGDAGLYAVQLRPVLFLSDDDDLHHQYRGVQRVSVRTAGRGHYHLPAALPDQNVLCSGGGPDDRRLSDFRRDRLHESDLRAGAAVCPRAAGRSGEAGADRSGAFRRQLVADSRPAAVHDCSALCPDADGLSSVPEKIQAG